jgi:hypothetical protein
MPLVSTAPTLSVTRGSLVQEVTQRWSDWLSQVVRLYVNGSDVDLVEMEWTVGPIDIEDGRSKEVVTKYFTDINNQGHFSTDSNGREFQPRLRDHRPTWNWTNVSPVAGNYYPLSTGITIDDGQTALGIVVDRAQGAASLQDGNVELMIHRRILYACALSVAINETGPDGRGLIITGSHRLFLGPTQANSTRLSVVERMRLQQQRQYFPLHPVFASGVPTNALPSPLSFIKQPLPSNVELMTLQQLNDGRVLLRLAHSFAVNESTALSQSVSVDLSTLFHQPIISIRRTTLTANANYNNSAREVRQREMGDDTTEVDATATVAANSPGAGVTTGVATGVVTLGPMQIATFIIDLQQRDE